MAGERVKLVVQNRAILGSAESRRLRKQGMIPGVLYGREEPIAISIPERDLRNALTGHGGTHAVLDVVVDSGKTHSSVLKEYQQDAVRGYITHVDLQEVRLDQPIQASVSLVLIGEPVGVKEGGVLNQVTTSVNIEALPLEVPEHLEFDVSELGIGDSARLDQVKAPEGVTILDDLEETVVASVTQQRAEEEPEGGAEATAAGEAAEGVEVPDGAEGEAAESDAATGDGEAAGTVEG
jgi:large subunit ribosomal protein L25